MDVPRVIPCMPGAELVQQVDEDTWNASIAVRLGPISLTFAAEIRREAADEGTGQVLLAIVARETRGRGAARARVTSSLAESEHGTEVAIKTELALTGAVAQYGRGIVQEVASQLVARFAECLRLNLQSNSGPPASAVKGKTHAISGLRLLASALLARLRRARHALPLDE
jgi:carbon monoxide dehydrogenase subunit G